MVKANISLGGKLLLIILTIIIYTLVVVGGIVGFAFYAYKNIKVRDIADLLGAADWIAQDYDKTIEGMVQELLPQIQDQTITVNSLISISPKLGETLDGLIEKVDSLGVVSIDSELLYATPVVSVPEQLSEIVVVTATLNSLSSNLGFSLPATPLFIGSEENPAWFYTQVNPEQEGGGYAAIEKAYLMSSTEYQFYTRTPVYLDTYEQDGETLPVAEAKEKQLYRLTGVEEANGVLTYNGSALYLGRTQTDEDGGVTLSYTRITPGNSAVYETDGNDALFALDEGEGLYVITGPSAEGDGFAYGSVLPDSSEGTVLTREIADPYKYIPLYVQADGEYVLATATDGEGGYLIDPDNGGYAIAEEYKDEYDFYYLSYEDSAPMTAEEAQAAAETQPVYVKTNGIGDIPVLYAIDTLSGILDMNALTLHEVELYFGAALTDNEMIERVMYVPLGQFDEALNAEMQSLYLSDFIELNGDSPRILLSLAYEDYTINADGSISSDSPRRLGDIESSMNELVISDLIEIDETGENSAPLLVAIKDWTLSDFENEDKINSLSLGEIMDIGEDESSQLLQSLKDVPLGGISDAVNELTLDEIVAIDESDPLLSALKKSTLESLADDISALPVQALFSDTMYEQTLVGTGADYAELKAIYGEDNLYIYEEGAYSLCPASVADGTNIYSPYKPVTDPDEYEGTILYYLDGGKMTAATGVTAWSLPDVLPDGVDKTTQFYLSLDGGGYEAASPAADGTYSADKIWYFDKATEKMMSLSLTPAAYGLLPSVTDGNGEPTVSLFTKLTPAQTVIVDGEERYVNGNLFWFDISKETWVLAETEAHTDRDGNVTYTLADASAAGKTLYTYGSPVGVWKYLLLQNGAEQTCTVQNIDALVANVSDNIDSAAVGDLYADGMIDISDPDALNADLSAFGGKYVGMTLGELTIEETMDLVLAAIDLIS